MLEATRRTLLHTGRPWLEGRASGAGSPYSPTYSPGTSIQATESSRYILRGFTAIRYPYT